MRADLYDPKAKRQTVSLSVNADLYAKVKNAGINASRVAEAALAGALREHVAEALREQIREDIAAIEAYEAEHGSFPEMIRAYNESLAAGGTGDDAAA
jgi:post-segregation antitoxin (ccd killing protein)